MGVNTKLMDLLLDHFGTTVTVGATVKLVGTVVAIQQDPHFGTIVVAPLYPTGPTVPPQSGGGNPQSLNFATPNQQLPTTQYGFEAAQLVVGA